MNELFNKRSDLLIDYISQILVYGSDTKGIISLDNHNFDDGKYLIVTVSVIKNSYFRWHDLGIKSVDILKFYKFLSTKVVDKFKEFNITKIDNKIVISSSVNKNIIEFCFNLDNKAKKDWFDKFNCQV